MFNDMRGAGHLHDAFQQSVPIAAADAKNRN